VDESLAWLRQAAADRDAAEWLAAGKGRSWLCHSIAKWQQTVEKAIKAVIAALREAKVLHIEIGYQHGVDRFIRVLIRLPRARDNRAIQQHLHGLLSEETRAGIRELDGLVPHRPPAGADPQRNTEYPFVGPRRDWTYPAAKDIFSDEESGRFRSLAHRILDQAGRIVSMIRRRPR
jgi:HEPN domain-containing protein